MNFTLRQLEHLVAVVEEGSIVLAARRLRVSPAGLSLSLSQLEQSLGVQLTLRRRGKGVAVTPAGRWVYAEARAVLHRTEDIQRAAEAVRGQLTGPLSVGCFSTLSPWLFPRIASYFVSAHSAVDLQISEGASSDLQAKLRRGDLDAALLYRNHLENGIRGEDVVPVRLQLALAPSHPLAAREEVHLKELEEEDAILLGVQPSIGHVETMMRKAGVTPRIKWRSTNAETIRSMVARGLGYSIIMGRPFGDHTYDGLPISYCRIADELEPNAVVVAYPDGTIPTAKITALVEFCKHEFGHEGEYIDSDAVRAGAL
ncbi:LysR family transcriptional regulator [Microbacterium barkeri]|uniref:LysR family transcriptional regulator n=1 Tax=Microbacterium barkeri TaxID=33917 RepID=A0A9W6H467_9MICO|nr:LysR substrate-binding domain-containing protein [Microbacterium barkeri]MDI6944269.1 LysR substrate-binding domain-containing protein [Microbacterium barkeri]GLJ62282.1 LysR family transcriptional regulator [Microbacterium barkeri]